MANLDAFDGTQPDTVPLLSKLVLLNDIEGLINRILTMDSLNYTDNQGRTALHWGALLGRVGCLRLLLEAGADVNCLSFTGETALTLASRIPSEDPFVEGFMPNQCEVLRLLLDAGCDPNKETMEGQTCLQDLCAEFNEEAIKLLISYGARANHVNEVTGMDCVYPVVDAFCRRLADVDLDGLEASELFAKLSRILRIFAEDGKVDFKSRSDMDTPFWAGAPGVFHPFVSCWMRLAEDGPKARRVAEFLLEKGFKASKRVMEYLIRENATIVVGTLMKAGESVDFLKDIQTSFRRGARVHVIALSESYEMARLILSVISPLDLDLSTRKFTLGRILSEAGLGTLPFTPGPAAAFRALVEDGSFFLGAEKMVFDLEYFYASQRLQRYFNSYSHSGVATPYVVDSFRTAAGGGFIAIYSLVGVVVMFLGHQGLEFAGKLVELGEPAPPEYRVVPDMVAAVRYCVAYPEEAKRNNFSVLNWFEELSHSADLNALVENGCMCSSVVAPLALLHAVNDARVMFEVLRRGGKVELFVRHWDALLLRFFELEGQADVRMDRFLLVLFLLEMFATPAKFKESDAERMLELAAAGTSHSVESLKQARSPQWEQLLQSLRTPKTLKNLSRLAVRDSLSGQYLDRATRHLHVPEELKRYVLFVGEDPLE